jgi:hypothetical protein
VSTSKAEVPPVHVRGLSPDVWRAIRAEAVQQGWSVATLIEHMWSLWREQQEQRG